MSDSEDSRLCKSQVEFHFHVLRGTGDNRKPYELRGAGCQRSLHVH